MTVVEAFNLISAVMSTVLAIVALYLAIVFYRLSTAEAQRSQKSAEEISASVKRVEALFSTMYADTFTMMRETVTDMRAHVWRIPHTKALEGGETESTTEEQTTRTQTELVDAITDISARLGVTEGDLKTLRDQVTPIVHEALDSTRIQRVEKMKRVVIKGLMEKQPVASGKLSVIARVAVKGSVGDYMQALKDLLEKDEIAILNEYPVDNPRALIGLAPPF
ncbi:hypothetical protein ACN27J_16410 [Solwaraspora sp. WMMB762]|uniref:hypothetical protein n=1 Tax=Solwaraspora sp. WMMB762 TaxID=3404120 RepID=UPI003B94F85C